jgi:hypothetical protein
MYKSLIGACGIAAAKAYGGNGHPAYSYEHINRHNKGQREIDRAEGIRVNAPADKNTVNNGKKEKTTAAEYGRHNVVQYVLRPCPCHV